MTMRKLDKWQFQVNRTDAENAVPIGSYFLHLGPGQKAVEVRSSSGTCFGYLLGSPIDLQKAALIESPLEVDADEDIQFGALARVVLPRVGGNYIWMSLLDGAVRIVPDAMAQLGCVYDPQMMEAGSTAGALLDDADYKSRFDADLYARLDLEKEGWFPAGLTAHRGVKRLLPNHYLDLQNWEVKRLGRITPEDEITPEAAADEIAGIIETQLRALAGAEKRLAVTLTAGLDSRVVLACSRAFADQIDFMTLQTIGNRSMDAIIAKKIATKHRLEHIELPLLTSSKAERDAFISRGGHCVTDSNSRYHTTVWKIAETHNLAGGLGGEIGRAFLYKSDLPDLDRIDGRFLNRLLGLPETDEVIEALDRWLETAPKSSTQELLDYAYYENRMGPWGCAQSYSDPTLERFSPMISHRTMELMLGLPYDWKLGSAFTYHIIKDRWPELMEFRVNSLGPIQDRFFLAVEALRNPHKVSKLIRKKMAKFG